MKGYIVCTALKQKQNLKAKVKKRVCKQCASIIRVLLYVSVKVINEERDISHEEVENSEILVMNRDDNHAPVINIYELLMNSEFVEIQTDRDD